MKIGIIREGKVPPDHRVALSPEHCKQILAEYSEVSIAVQPSKIRCFKDEEYTQAGIPLQEDLSDCDILFGVKEVPIPDLIPDKTYFFFSHTIKKQPYNKVLLQEVLKKKIDLIDYECLKNEQGQRVVAFGRFAGIVGAYNGIMAYGKKYGLFDLKPANACYDMEEMWDEFQKVKLPPIKILLTGGGRVAKGAQEVLDGMGIKNVAMPEYTEQTFEEAVYIQLDSDAYNEHSQGKAFDYNHFYNNPGEYQSTFSQYLPHTDVLIAGAYWDPKAPVLFQLDDMNSDDFKIRVIADITCDIQGSIPTTTRATTIADPIYDFSRSNHEEVAAFSSQDNLTVMSVDNLPCELPRDASIAFGNMIINHTLKDLLLGDKGIIKGAKIASKGQLTEQFSYLSDYVAD